MPQNTPNTQPIFIRTPAVYSIVLSSELGDTLPTSTLTPKTLLTAIDPGIAIETIEIQPTGPMVATTLNLYLFNQTGTQGQSRLISQTILPAIVAGAIVPPATTPPPLGAFTVTSILLPLSLSPVNNLSPSRILRLPEGWQIRASLSVAIANPIIVTAFGGSY